MEQGDDGYKRGASALLRKRGEILSDIAECQERVAQSKNDLAAVERCLALMGAELDLPTQEKRAPKAQRVQLYYRNELRTFIRKQLEASDGPLSTRQMALALIELEGRDAGDRRLLSDMVRRLGSSLHKMRADGAANSVTQSGVKVWSLTSAPLNEANKPVIASPSDTGSTAD